MRQRPARLSLVALVVGAISTHVIASCAEGAPEPAAPPDEAGTSPDTQSTLPPIDRCPAGTFCAMELPPAPLTLNGIWGSAPDNVWIVGSPDIDLHWDGSRLVTGKVDTRQSLFGIWGSGEDDVWTFSTSTTMWHTRGFDDDGAGWSRSKGTTGMNDAGWPTPIFAMWGRSANDVWAVGAGAEGSLARPTVFHCEGWHEGEPAWRARDERQRSPRDRIHLVLRDHRQPRRGRLDRGRGWQDPPVFGMGWGRYRVEADQQSYVGQPVRGVGQPGRRRVGRG